MISPKTHARSTVVHRYKGRGDQRYIRAKQGVKLASLLPGLVSQVNAAAKENK